MDFSEYRKQIEAISLSLESLRYVGLSIEKTACLSVKTLLYDYRGSSDRRYLVAACLIMQAALGLGVSYDDGKELFEQVLLGLNIEKKSFLSQVVYKAEKIKLNRRQIGSILSWITSSTNPVKKSEIVEDIFDKASRKKNGHYYYEYQEGYYGKVLPGCFRKYELIVGEKETFFIDVNSRKYYAFLEEDKEKAHDKDSGVGR